LGFESLWAWDHVILGVEPSFPILDAVGTLTAIAARTSKIRLGTGVLVLPLRNPTVAAKAIGTLDVISKGRLVLGVAAGWYAREFDAVGVPFKQRGRLFERNLDILIRLWTEERVTLQADEFNLRDAVMRPKTVQRPRPPILIGGYVDAVLKRVDTRGDGWLTYFYTPESYTRSWQKILAFAREAGRDPRTLSGTNQLAILAGAYGHVVSSKQVLDTMSAWGFAAPTALLSEPRYARAADVLGDHAGQHPAVRGGPFHRRAGVSPASAMAGRHARRHRHRGQR